MIVRENLNWNANNVQVGEITGQFVGGTFHFDEMHTSIVYIGSERVPNHGSLPQIQLVVKYAKILKKNVKIKSISYDETKSVFRKEYFDTTLYDFDKQTIKVYRDSVGDFINGKMNSFQKEFTYSALGIRRVEVALFIEPEKYIRYFSETFPQTGLGDVEEMLVRAIHNQDIEHIRDTLVFATGLPREYLGV